MPCDHRPRFQLPRCFNLCLKCSPTNNIPQMKLCQIPFKIQILKQMIIIIYNLPSLIIGLIIIYNLPSPTICLLPHRNITPKTPKIRYHAY